MIVIDRKTGESYSTTPIPREAKDRAQQIYMDAMKKQIREYAEEHPEIFENIK